MLELRHLLINYAISSDSGTFDVGWDRMHAKESNATKERIRHKEYRHLNVSEHLELQQRKFQNHANLQMQ